MPMENHRDGVIFNSVENYIFVLVFVLAVAAAYPPAGTARSPRRDMGLNIDKENVTTQPLLALLLLLYIRKGYPALYGTINTNVIDNKNKDMEPVPGWLL